MIEYNEKELASLYQDLNACSVRAEKESVKIVAKHMMECFLKGCEDFTGGFPGILDKKRKTVEALFKNSNSEMGQRLHEMDEIKRKCYDLLWGMMYEEPLKHMPVFISAPPLDVIATWRLRIGK